MDHKLQVSVIAIAFTLMASVAWSQARKTNLIDHSSNALIEATVAKTVMSDNISDRVLKLYPPKKYVFVSQVEGGLTAAGACVVTARVMLLPLTAAMKAVLLRPQKMATAFDSIPGASMDQCKTLARDKLKEATVSVVSALVNS